MVSKFMNVMQYKTGRHSSCQFTTSRKMTLTSGSPSGASAIPTTSAFFSLSATSHLEELFCWRLLKPKHCTGRRISQITQFKTYLGIPPASFGTSGAAVNHPCTSIWSSDQTMRPECVANVRGLSMHSRTRRTETLASAPALLAERLQRAVLRPLLQYMQCMAFCCRFSSQKLPCLSALLSLMLHARFTGTLKSLIITFIRQVNFSYNTE